MEIMAIWDFREGHIFSQQLSNILISSSRIRVRVNGFKLITTDIHSLWKINTNILILVILFWKKKSSPKAFLQCEVIVFSLCWKWDVYVYNENLKAFSTFHRFWSSTSVIFSFKLIWDMYELILNTWFVYLFWISIWTEMKCLKKGTSRNIWQQ